MSRKRKNDSYFVDHYDDWIETYKVGAIREVTLNKYYMTAKTLRRIVPDLKISELDRLVYQNILNEYAITHEKQTTMDFHHQVKACISDLFHDGLIERDPTYRAIIKGKPAKPKKMKFLQADELKKLVRSLDLGTEINMDWFTLVVAKTGLRFAEALALTPKDFDFKNNTLSISKTWEYKLTSGQFAPTKNESSVRTIAIDWQLVGQFGPILKDMPADEPIFIKKDANGHYKRAFNSTYNNFLARKCKEAGVTEITFHGLRHTHASVLLSAGITVQSISKRLGHSNVTTTQEVYMHIIDELAQKDNQIMIGTLTSIA
ncbi:site-specific integrase [Sporolactobacillus shoreicorticis]|uniref:Site-specific integrase n=1 Tax=Sporolactobacillus shoreicorticis TaxID=1923877 RepID=A0ABW5RZ59_9BACL|nr:site-specific integrase [Sporolactobacillus shoreicorticis]MCO7128324.1 site-specific integrase [Sporolactobacillus shoreicorticis]